MSTRQVKVDGKAITVKFEDVEVTPSGELQEITPSEGCNGLSKVTVKAVTSDVDADIAAENIRAGVDILGVTGTYTGTGLDGDFVSYLNDGQSLTTLNDPRITNIRPYAFYTPYVNNGSVSAQYVYNLSTVNLANCTYVDSYAFGGCKNLTTVYMPSLNLVTPTGHVSGSYQFAYTGLTEVTSEMFPGLTTMSDSGYTFYKMPNLTTVSLPNVTSITGGSNRFAENAKLTSVSIPNATTIYGNNMFYCNNMVSALTTANFENCTNLTGGDQMFFKNKKLTSVNFNNLTTMSGTTSSAFRECTSLESISFPKLDSAYCWQSMFSGCTALKNFECLIKSFTYTDNNLANAFASCTSLETLSFPNLKSIGYNGLYCLCSGDTNLKTVSFPSLETFTSNYNMYYAFQNCTNLKTVNFPKLKDMSSCSYAMYYAFYNCTSLEQIEFPELANTYAYNNALQYAFAKCTSLKSIKMPKLSGMIGYWASAINNCTSLVTWDFGYITSLYDSMVLCDSSNPSSLRKVILRSPTMCTTYRAADNSSFFLANCPHFKGTTHATANPEGLKDGYIYVPDDLVATYQANSSWSAWADRFKGLSELNEAADTVVNVLAGDVNAPREILLDVESVQDVTFNLDGISAFTITNVDYTDKHRLDFNINTTTSNTGTYEVPVSIKISDEETITCTLTVNLVDAIIENEVTESHTGNYYFIKQTSGTYEGYYKSNNTSASSVATSTLTINSTGMQYVYLDCINGGEYNYDYGVVSKLDKTLGTDGNVKYTFASDIPSATEVKTIAFGRIPNGTHTIDIRYLKDGTKNVPPDCFCVKVCFENTPRS